MQHNTTHAVARNLEEQPTRPLRWTTPSAGPAQNSLLGYGCKEGWVARPIVWATCPCYLVMKTRFKNLLTPSYLHIASLLCWMIGQLIAPCSSYYSLMKTSELWCFGLLFPLGLYLSRRDGFRNATINRTKRHPSAFLAILWCLCQEMP